MQIVCNLLISKEGYLRRALLQTGHEWLSHNRPYDVLSIEDREEFNRSMVSDFL